MRRPRQPLPTKKPSPTIVQPNPSSIIFNKSPPVSPVKQK